MDILALTHITVLSNFEKLLDSKGLYTPIERDQFNILNIGVNTATTSFMQNIVEEDVILEYPGVFMGVMTKAHVGTNLSKFGKDPLYLVFSTSLLKRPDWHLSLYDLNGFFTGRTFIRETLHMCPISIQETWDLNEIVFHNYVPLEYLEEIWVDTYEMKTIVENLLARKPNIKISKIVVTSTHPMTRCTKLSDKIIQDEEWERRIALGFNMELLSYNSCFLPQVIFGICLNAGMTEDIFKRDWLNDLQQTNKKVDTLNKLNVHLWKYYLKDIHLGKVKPILKVLPPFANWSTTDILTMDEPNTDLNTLYSKPLLLVDNYVEVKDVIGETKPIDIVQLPKPMAESLEKLPESNVVAIEHITSDMPRLLITNDAVVNQVHPPTIEIKTRARKQSSKKRRRRKSCCSKKRRSCSTKRRSRLTKRRSCSTKRRRSSSKRRC